MNNAPSHSDTSHSDTGQSEQDLEKQIELLKSQLMQAQKMTALGELVSTTTHEFNNVLMTIMNYAKMGMRHHDDATRNKSFDKILAASQRAAKITNAVLGVARNRKDTFDPTDLPQLVQESLVLLEREMNKYRIHVETDFQDVPAARANGNQIQQVLLNLLINARQAMADGGTLYIGVQHDSKANTVDLIVRDSGSGISKEKLRKIFDPFFTTKQGPDDSGKGGTGLGLAACKDIVEAHRGRIRVESSIGKGTCFTIKLPVAVPAPAFAPTVVPNASTANASTIDHV